MELTVEIISGLNTALNEARVLGIEFLANEEIIAATFAPIAIDEAGKVPEDNRVQFIFKSIGRLIASYRLGCWNDHKAKIVLFDPQQLSEKVSEFSGCSIYGWKFFDCEKESSANWQDKLSCEFLSPDQRKRKHSFDLFQASHSKDGDTHIDIKFWFDDLELYDSSHNVVSIQHFIDNGKRAWDSIYSGQPNDFGIYPSATYKFKH